ncbi:MAG: cyclase family protein [Desulfobacteraceae bacterium]|nr:MAG: cyclase family protein [Desulfobacteraceae bacterium]
MKIIDLTHTIEPNMPCYPGTEPPKFAKLCTLEEHGFVEHKITFFSHIGTHMDAPAHVLPRARTLDQFDVGHFAGRAVCLDLMRLSKQTIDLRDLTPYRETIADKEFVLLCTGWDRFWGTPEYFKDFPVLSREATEWLAEFNLKGVGLDMISIDAMDSVDLANHKILLARDTLIIENLTGLAELGQEAFTFICLPLKFREADGAPVRAMAMMDNCGKK